LDRRTWQYDGEPVLRAIQEDVGLPCVIKPSRQGSSFGISVIRDYRELTAALDAALALDEEVYAEEYIEGREVTCGVLDVDPEGRLRALEVTEIRPKTAAFFDFEAKYTPGASEEITPAPLDTDTTNEVKQMAVDVHEIVGCSGWSRSDFIIGEEGPVWLEVNTVPGLTETSLYPQAARAAGIPFNQLVLMFIEHALRRHAQERQRG
jgi:D-alanine-D-alanine ligase